MKTSSTQTLMNTMLDSYLQQDVVAPNFRSTGISKLDAMIGGWKPGVHLISARPSMGLTAFALTQVYQVLSNLKANEVVIYLSDKDSSTAIMHRLLSIATEIDLSIIQNGKLNKQEYEQVKSHPITRKLKDNQLIIMHENVSTVYTLRSLVHDLKKEGKKTVMLFVDSLQSLLYNVRSQEIKEVMLDLNLLSEEYECPLICTMPLGRSVEHRTFNYPRLTDLDAKMVNIASGVFFLMRPDYYQLIGPSEGDMSETHLVVAQNEGQLDTILLGMNRKTLTMGELVQNSPIN